MKIILKLIILITFCSIIYNKSEASSFDAYQINHFPMRIDFSAQYSDLYNFQFNIDLKWFSGKGFNKNLEFTFLEPTYGLRVNNNKEIEHKFKFISFEYQGFAYKTLLEYGNKEWGDTSGQYLFNQWGIKLLEWSNIENYTEFNVFKISTDFLLEHRTKNNWEQYILEYSKKAHNFYIMPEFSLELSKLKIDDKYIKLPDSTSIIIFWDTPLGINLQIGYDWSQELEYSHQYKGNVYKNKLVIVNSIYLFSDYRYLPFNKFQEFSYGLKAKISTLSNYLDFNLSFRKTEIKYKDAKNSFYKISIEYPFYFTQLFDK